MALTDGLNWEQRLTIPLLNKQQLKAAFQFYEQLCEPYSSKNRLNQAYFKVTTESREKLIFVHTDYSMSSKNIEQLFSDDSIMEAIKRFDYSTADASPWPDEEAFSVTFIPADCSAKYYSKIMIRPAWLGEDK